MQNDATTIQWDKSWDLCPPMIWEEKKQQNGWLEEMSKNWA